MTHAAALIGVDVGGTFTDAVVIERGAIYRAKSPSTYPEVGRGVIAACRLAAEASGRGLNDLLPDVVRFGLGTTAITNVIATRRGLRVGLLTTRGFEDMLRLARARVEQVNGWQQPIQSLVEREAVVGIDERIDRNGAVLKALDAKEVHAAGRFLVDTVKVESIAVSFLWSFMNPSHEKQAMEILREALPGVPITGAAELRPVIREYERTTLAVLNAYSFGAYTGIESLADDLRTAGLKVPLLLCHSGGGTISIEQVREQPVWLAESGPAAGVTAASYVATMCGEARALTCDLGGTSFDVSHIDAGAPARVQRGDLMGIWTALPRVDVESVGAGGGSVAWIDDRGMPRVGPHSVGASPGPACYGRGGTEPALTDALLLLGYIDPGKFLGGRMVLDLDASRAACERVGKALGFNAIETAWGIRQIALAEMTQAARARLAVHALAASNHPLVSYGGCGPLFTAEVAHSIGAPRVLVAEFASVLSAFGAATMDVRRERVRSLVRLLPTDGKTLDTTFAELRAQVLQDLTRDGVAPASQSVEFEADMRFGGQRWEVTVTLPSTPSLSDGGAELEALFRDEYLRRYGSAADNASGVVELVAIRAIGIGKTPFFSLFKENSVRRGQRTVPPSAQRLVQLNRTGKPLPVNVYAAVELAPGDALLGPALIDIGDTTAWVPEAMQAFMDENRTLIVENRS